MREHTLRHRIVRSAFTLPVSAFLALVVWGLLAPLSDWQMWGGLGIAFLLTYLLMELTNRNQLLRVRSRMVSTTFLWLFTATAFLHPATWEISVPVVCYALAYFQIFASYQQERSERVVFHAYLLLGIGSFFYPLMLFLAATLYLSLLVSLRSLTWRSFAASLLGMVLPSIFYLAWVVGHDFPTAEAFGFLSACKTPALPDWMDIPQYQIVNVAFLGILILLSLFHYVRTHFNDKLRIREFYYTFIRQEVTLMILLVIYPDYFLPTYALLLVNSAPLIGHYWALARGRRWMTIWFMVWIIAVVLLGFYNHGGFEVLLKWA